MTYLPDLVPSFALELWIVTVDEHWCSDCTHVWKPVKELNKQQTHTSTHKLAQRVTTFKGFFLVPWIFPEDSKIP